MKANNGPAIRINPNCPHNKTLRAHGGESGAKRYAREHGVAFVIRGVGGTLYFMDGGKLRQKSWPSVGYTHPITTEAARNLCDASEGRAR